jgi:transposase
LAQLLRADLLPEAWIAPVEVRALRTLPRHRVALVRLRAMAKNRIHAVLAEAGLDRADGALWTGPGRAWLGCRRPERGGSVGRRGLSGAYR